MSWLAILRSENFTVCSSELSCSVVAFEFGNYVRVGQPGERTVPTFVTAYMFCASRDTRVSYGRCLLIQGYFCAF